MQRNQNQSAVGGKDLVGTYGLAIEVKRQEALSINTWWKQCVISATELKEEPVLLFRQNGKKWRCLLLVGLQMPLERGSTASSIQVRAEIDYDAFKQWFKAWSRRSVATDVLINPVAYPGLFDELAVYG